MNDITCLSHIVWDCRYRLIWVQNTKKNTIGHLRKHLGDVFREIALKKESKVLEGHLMGDHVHMMISIPPKCAVSQIVVYIKGKSAIHIARRYMGHERNFTGQHFWVRGYYVSTAGRDEEIVANT